MSMKDRAELRKSYVDKYKMDAVKYPGKPSLDYTRWLEDKVLGKSCALYVDYEKSCEALKKRKEESK